MTTVIIESIDKEIGRKYGIEVGKEYEVISSDESSRNKETAYLIQAKMCVVVYSSEVRVIEKPMSVVIKS